LPAALRMKQFPDRTSWQRHISVCIPDYVKSLESKDSLPCPHPLCAAVRHSESDLWDHLGDTHDTHEPDAGKKRRRQRGEGEDERAEMSGAATTKRRRLQEKLEDEDSKVPGGRKSAVKGCSEDPLGYTFVNISAMNFDPGPTDVIEMAGAFSSSSSHRSTLDGSVWDNCDDCYSTDTSLSSLSDNILKAVPQTGEDCHFPWTTRFEAATVDLLEDSEPWNFDAIADAISSPIESQEGWILASPNIPPSDLSSVPMELIDPELQDALPSPPSPPVTADSVQDADGTTPTPRPGHIESTVTQPLCANLGVGDQPVAIDAEMCEVEALLAKWKQGKTNWYLVKWEGFPDEENMWVKKDGIDQELVKAFEATYQGNFLGVRLLKKRVRRGKAEYLVEWKGRPKRENSWEKEATISRERITEFEAS
jgi:Chromo (CHRromatin Organisation MOdifier) domain